MLGHVSNHEVVAIVGPFFFFCQKLTDDGSDLMLLGRANRDQTNWPKMAASVQHVEFRLNSENFLVWICLDYIIQFCLVSKE